MADIHTTNLCVQIIRSHFGPVSAAIASVLLHHGRLPFPHIVRLSSASPHIARGCILVLVQHNLLWHASDESDEVVLELNVDECLMRLRFGRYIHIAETLFGKVGASILQSVLDHGKLRPPEILSELSSTNKKDLVKYTTTLHTMVSSAYLKPMTVESHMSPTDKLIQYVAEEKRKIGGIPTARQLREAREAAEIRLKREEAEREKIGLIPKPVEANGWSGKRKHNATENDTIVNDKVYFGINSDKFNVHLRNGIIERSAEAQFNRGAALVLRAALKITEPAQKSVHELRTDPVTVSSIVVQLADEDSLSEELAYSSRKVSNSTVIKDYLGMLSCSDNPTPGGKAASFVSFSASKVQVEFQIIAERLRRQVLEAVTLERHGKEGVRIFRLLLDTGKLEEKQISKTVMMVAKDVRRLLAALASDSLISTQEVPKSTDRNPTRTFYLWYVDLAKAYSVVLGNMWKTLYNIEARRQAERETPMVKAVLEKCERSDVQEDESLLTELDKEVISEWKQKEEKLTLLEMRVEEAVFILRDLAPGLEDG